MSWKISGESFVINSPLFFSSSSLVGSWMELEIPPHPFVRPPLSDLPVFTQPILRHCVLQTVPVEVVCLIAAILTIEHQQMINLQGVLLGFALFSRRRKKLSSISEMIHMSRPLNQWQGHVTCCFIIHMLTPGREKLEQCSVSNLPYWFSLHSAAKCPSFPSEQ